jgi:hypothetical protein
LKEQGQVIEEWVELTERTFNFAHYARAWFRNGDMATKRAVFAALGSHLIVNSRQLTAELHPFFHDIVIKRDLVEKELVEVITPKNIDDKRQIANFLAKCPILRGRPDLNRQPPP